MCPGQVPDDLSEDALSITGLAVSEASEQQLHECWEAKGATMRELYPAFSDFMDLIRQVLARDVRSVHQRLHGRGKGATTVPGECLRHAKHAKADDQSLSVSDILYAQSETDAMLPIGSAEYQVVLQGIRVWYSVTQTRQVHVQRAEPVQ